MASPISDGLHLWTECLTKMGDHNYALFETFVRTANQETLEFLHRRIGQHSELAEHLRRNMTEFTGGQQDFAKGTINDWMAHAHKLSKLYWQNVEDRVEQANQTVASIIPFMSKAETNDGRKAA